MAFAYRTRPVYRHGADTPWGGDALRRVFGRALPDDRTGESLEASTLPGLTTALEGGPALREAAGGPLPLVLKLIDARERLSVQVHPNDGYAAAHEGGKAGKSEAWLILAAKPGARLVHGLLPGTDLRGLSGGRMEDCLRWVDARPGDVFSIPAGTVHAIGEGILLYEIQQASDLTYRFWDWGRQGPDGKPRALHWQKALAVARTDPPPPPTRGVTLPRDGGRVTRYLDTEYFRLEKLAVGGRMPLPPRPGFRLLTALCQGRLTQGAQALPFRPGDTLFLPDGAEGVVLEASGEVVVSGPGRA